MLLKKFMFIIGPFTVTLSEAKGLSRCAARCFAALSMTGLASLLFPPSVTLSHTCSERSSERSEGLARGAARCFAALILSAAKDDRAGTHTNAWIILFMCIIGGGRDESAHMDGRM